MHDPPHGSSEDEQLMAARPYGSGRLFVRVDARGAESWYGSWWSGSRRVKRRLGPKRRPGTREGLTQAQAEAELRRRIATTVVAPSSGAISLAEAGERYLAHLESVLERKPTTTQDYRIILDRHLLRFLGDVRLTAISAEWIAAFINSQRRAGLAANTVRNHVNFLHGLLGFALKRGWIAFNPVDQVDKPRQGRNRERRIQFLSPPEVEALVRAVPDDVLGEAERPLYLTGALTGLRMGELLALRWRDVDWVAGRIRVAESYTRGSFGSPKSTRGVRSVPLADRLAGELERRFQSSAFQGDDDFVFCHPQLGTVLDSSKLRKRFRRALEGARLRPIRFHDLRHTFGTQMAAAGAPLRAIQEWMGHADYSTTAVYAHYAPDSSNGAAFVERAFGRGGHEPLDATRGTPQRRGAAHPG